MLVDCFLDLRKAGVLVREVVDDAAVQRLIDDGRIGMTPAADSLRLLRDEGAFPARLGAAEVARLTRIGLLQGVSLDGETLVLPDGGRVAADLGDDRTLGALARSGLGRRLRGAFAHAAFFLGPLAFYEHLRTMPREERERIRMTGVGFVNQLYGDEALKVAQRRHARFINTGMMATITGAVVSDGLENGQVVSGVGGQYNFVAMAHALPEARSILMVRATREKGGEVGSNIVARYGHVTIPRHLRDVVVTEYGIADLRGRSDAEVAAAMIQIADSRFQESLADEARRNRKLPSGWRLPDRFRENSPERLARLLAPHREEGLCGEFPYGTDLSPIELTLAKALRALRRRLDARRFELPPVQELPKIVRAPESARPYLERMGLAEPDGFEEQLLQRVVLYALATHGAL
jgi:hypothetical protein